MHHEEYKNEKTKRKEKEKKEIKIEGTPNQIKQVETSKCQLKDVAKRGPKSKSWTRPYDPSGPHWIKEGRPILGCKQHALLT